MSPKKKKNRNENSNRRPGEVLVDEAPFMQIDPERKRRNMLPWFLFGMLLFVVYFVGCHADFVAHGIIFHPPRYTLDSEDAQIEQDPKNEKYSVVSFQNRKGDHLVGLYFAFNRIDKTNPPKGSILYCHGNGCNITDVIHIALQLRQDLHCNVLIFDYAGYGRSGGRPSTPGILEDGRSARDWLAKHDGIDKDQVIVYGQSLGGSVAIDLAAQDGARALVVESSFTSLGDMGRRMLPFLPLNWMLKERLASVEKIGNFHNPVFISHGKTDTVIPFSQGRRLFEAANEPKTFFVAPNDLGYHSAPHSREHREKLREFINSLPPLEMKER